MRIRVLFAHDTLNLGGSEKNALKIATYLDKNRFEPIMAYEQHASELLLAQAEQNGIDCHAVGVTEDAWLQFLKKSKPDVIMTTSYTRSLVYQPALYLGIPMIERGNGNSGVPTIYFDRILCENVNYANALRNHLAQVGLPDRSEVVVNGVDAADYPVTDKVAARARWGINAGAHVIGVVARIDPIKNISLQIKALQHLDAELHVLGPETGTEPKKLRELALELGVSDRVFFHGPSLEVASFMSACDIISLTSLSEGGPNCLIEAMIMGKPIVATDVGGIREVTGGEAVYVKEPNSVQQYVEAIMSVKTEKVEYETARRHDLAAYIARLSSVIEDVFKRHSMRHLYAAPQGELALTTIIVPVWNRAEYLVEAIDSVLAQTNPNWKMIITVDTNEPSSELMAVLNRYKDSRMSYLFGPHQNQCSAINRAVANVQTPYSSRLDSDDKLPPNAVDTLYRHIRKHPYAGYLYSTYESLRIDGSLVRYVAEEFFPQRLEEWYIARCWITWRNQEFRTIGGFNEEIDYAEDYLLSLMMMLCGARFVMMKESLYIAREHDLARLSTKYTEEERHKIIAQVRGIYRKQKAKLGITFNGEPIGTMIGRSERTKLGELDDR